MPRSKELVEGLCNLLKQWFTWEEPQRIFRVEKDCSLQRFLIGRDCVER